MLMKKIIMTAIIKKYILNNKKLFTYFLSDKDLQFFQIQMIIYYYEYLYKC